uniref:Uncharacterized protein n=1 Tax=Ditylenchus dipsaci TaxID=166011 RepID=A0A915CSP4_9BILA
MRNTIIGYHHLDKSIKIITRILPSRYSYLSAPPSKKHHVVTSIWITIPRFDYMASKNLGPADKTKGKKKRKIPNGLSRLIVICMHVIRRSLKLVWSAGNGVLQIRPVGGPSFRWLVPSRLLPSLQDKSSLKLVTIGRQICLPIVNMADGSQQTLSANVLLDNETFGAGKFDRNEEHMQFLGSLRRNTSSSVDTKCFCLI